jgi:hypothetical protein
MEYEVERIVDRKEKNSNVLYLVKWKGWSLQFNTWEPRKNLGNCLKLVEQFESEHNKSTKAPSSVAKASAKVAKPSSKVSKPSAKVAKESSNVPKASLRVAKRLSIPAPPSSVDSSKLARQARASKDRTLAPLKKSPARSALLKKTIRKNKPIKAAKVGRVVISRPGSLEKKDKIKQILSHAKGDEKKHGKIHYKYQVSWINDDNSVFRRDSQVSSEELRSNQPNLLFDYLESRLS